LKKINAKQSDHHVIAEPNHRQLPEKNNRAGGKGCLKSLKKFQEHFFDCAKDAHRCLEYLNGNE